MLLLLPEVLSPKEWSVKVSPQVWRCFNPGNYAALWHMLSDWVCVKRSAVEQCEQHEDDIKKQYSPQLCLPRFLHRVLSWFQAQPHSQEFSSSLYLLTGTVRLIIGSVPQSQPTKASYVPVQYSMQKYNSCML